MPDDCAIACTLEATALGSRLAEIRSFTAAHLVSHQLAGNELHLRYRAGAGPQLRRLVDLEQACCAFLAFQIEETPAGSSLTINAPPETGEAARWLFAEFLPGTVESEPVASCGCSRGAACR
jgi:hypothetical protein